jgi:four helix bundle protein
VKKKGTNARQRAGAAEGFYFENLLVYQRAIDFIEVVYKATPHMPPSEQFGLRSQFQRAATSIALNIAEGSGGTDMEFCRYARDSRKSVRECVAITEVASRVTYFDPQQRQFLRERLIELSRMLSGLLRSLGKGKDRD